MRTLTLIFNDRLSSTRCGLSVDMIQWRQLGNYWPLLLIIIDVRPPFTFHAAEQAIRRHQTEKS
jgi:hypothetical protein